MARAESFTLAMCQMLVEGGRLDANLGRAREMIADAGRRGCAVAVLPECLDLGWTDPSARDRAQPVPGPTSDLLCSAARDAGIHVVAGITERDGERIYNTAILVSPGGEILLKHRKINVLDIAQDLYSIGDRLGVADTPLGTIGVNICADNFTNAHALAHSLARMGAQTILSPSAWAVPADHDNDEQPYGAEWVESYTALARLYGIVVIGVSNVGVVSGGPWKGRRCIGCSLAVGVDGEVLAKGPYGETAACLIEVRLQLAPPAAWGTAIAGMLAAKGHEPV